MPDDLAIMIEFARHIVEGKPVPPLPVEAQIRSLARTVLRLAEGEPTLYVEPKATPLGPSERDMAKSRSME